MDFDDFEEDRRRRWGIGAQIMDDMARAADSPEDRARYTEMAERARHPNGWGAAYQTGTVYKIIDAEIANDSMGSCPNMDGKLKLNDLALCIGHSGDYFHSFVLIEFDSDGNPIPLPNTDFGAYGGIGEKHSQVTNQQLAIVEFLMEDDGGASPSPTA